MDIVLFLIFATIATLVFVPVVFSMVHSKHDPKAVNSRTDGPAGVQHAH